MSWTVVGSIPKIPGADGKEARTALHNAIISYCMPYVPFETGTLANSPWTASEPGSGQVIYNTPYARYLYYGQVYGPNIPFFDDDSEIPTYFRSPAGKKKHPTGRPLTYSQDLNPQAGPFWFDRMRGDHLEDIVEEVQDVVAGLNDK